VRVDIATTRPRPFERPASDRRDCRMPAAPLSTSCTWASATPGRGDSSEAVGLQMQYWREMASRVQRRTDLCIGNSIGIAAEIPFLRCASQRKCTGRGSLTSFAHVARIAADRTTDFKRNIRQTANKQQESRVMLTHEESPFQAHRSVDLARIPQF